ncbi:MAG: acyltransferase family protein [Actinomycetes bacterium]|nr:acyltransferase family protein [Actinomycetes bacterium]MDX5380364.1 acyltransferase family protein [Actinomycetes bacterium]MDX5399152.1 acyltransferase family protein [Actinomycetes bacterium]MDX5450097.1 acyltransferase family protein [Actinomycetes bacterium]
MASRDHLIDAARVLAVATVVVYHALFFEVSLVDGRLEVERWVPGEPILVLGWFVMILPVFFIAAGYGHAASAESRDAGGGDLGRLARRGSRLAGPIVLFVTVLAVLATAVAWWPGGPPSLPYPGTDGLGRLELATAVSRDYADFLWFLVAYLVVVALADPMVRLAERWGGGAVLALAVAAAVVDQLGGALRDANWVLVWLACHQLGVGLRRGWFAHAWVTATTAAAGVVVLVAVAGYPLSPIANYYPPSVAVVVLGVAQVSVLAVLQRAGVMRAISARWERRLALVGAHLVTVYLWQAACIILAIAVLASVGRAVPGLTATALHPAAILVVSVAVIVALVPGIARVERWVAPSWERLSARAGAAGFAMLLAGTALVWRNGAVLHPDRPWSSAGVLLVWAAAGGIRHRMPRTRNMQG